MSVNFRFIAKLENCLALDGETADARELAAQYADACATAHERLTECMDLLRAKSEYAALQLAQSPPPLLDVLAALSFEGAAAWRELCEERGFPVPVPFNEWAIRKIEDLYSKQVKATGTLYREFRKAALKRDLSRTVAVLRALTHADPDDANARQQLRQFEQAWLEHRLREAGESLRAGNTLAAVEVLDAIENENWSIPLEGEQLDQLRAQRRNLEKEEQRARLADLLGILQGALRDQRWRLAANAIAQVDALIAAGEALQDRGQKTLLGNARVAVEQAQRFQDFQDRTTQACEQAQRAHTSGAPRKRLESAARELCDIQHSIHASDMDAKAELLEPIQNELSVLDKALAKNRFRRRLMMAAGMVGVLLAVAALTLWSVRQSHRQAFVDACESLLEARAVEAAQTKLAQIHRERPRFVPAHTLREGSTQLAAMVDRERELWLQFKQLQARVEDIQARDSGLMDVDDPEALMQNHSSLYEALAPEFKDKARASVEHTRTSWQLALKRAHSAFQHDFNEQLEHAKMLLGADSRMPPEAEAFRASLPSLRELFSRLRTLARQPPAGMEPDPALLDTLHDLETRAAEREAALRTHDRQVRSLREAVDLGTHLELREALVQSSFQNAPHVRASRQVLENRDVLNNPGAAFYLSGNNALIDHLARVEGASINPDSLSRGEEERALRLLDDPSFRLLPNAMRYDLVAWYSASGKSPVRTLYTRDPVRPERIEGQGVPEQAFVFEELTADGAESRSYSYRILSADRKSGQALENPRPVAEGRLARALLDTFDRRSVTFTRPPLQYLDELVRARDTSPLFRAQTALALLRLMRDRGMDWGLEFSPSAKALHEQLETHFGSGEIPPGWWMRPEAVARIREFETLMAEYADPEENPSFAAEARFVMAALTRLRDQDFDYVGYVDETIGPVWQGQVAAHESLAGLSAAARNLVPITPVDDTLMPRPMPGTPLLRPVLSLDAFADSLVREDVHLHHGKDLLDPYIDMRP